jgi:hypothetical protein
VREGATGSESAVATQGKLAGSAVKVAVAALHRLDRQPVADRPATHAQRRARGGKSFSSSTSSPSLRASSLNDWLDLYLK